VTKIALAIAGSEATGGAGAQTDIKTFHQLGVYGCTALTCIVSFDPANDFGHRFVQIDPQVIHDQIEASVGVHSQIDAVKIGMLGTPTTIGAVADALKTYQFPQVVLDPVLICKGQEPGAALDTDNALREQVLPLADLVTPNLFETQVLAGVDEITTVDQLKDAARRIHDHGVPAVLAKAGTLLGTGTALDVFYDGQTMEVLEVPAVGSRTGFRGRLHSRPPPSLQSWPRGPSHCRHVVPQSRSSSRRSRTGCMARLPSTTPTRAATPAEPSRGVNSAVQLCLRCCVMGPR